MSATPMTVDGSEHYLAIALPSREHPSYPEVLALLKAHGFLPEPSNGKWWLRDRHKTLSFLAAHGESMRGRFGARFTPNFERNTAAIQSAVLTASAQESGGQFEVTVGLRAGAASDADLRDALVAGRDYVEIGGKVVLLGAETLRKLAHAQRALAGDPGAPVAARQKRRLPVTRAAETDALLESLAPGFQSPAAWKSRAQALRNLSTLQPAPIPSALDRQLRPYQRLGAAWLWHLFQHELGGVLADEMGLGKTVQALALLSAIQTGARASPSGGPDLRGSALRAGRRATPGEVKASGPIAAALRPPDSIPPAPRPFGLHLVVCPASLIENWRREAARFAPQLATFVHHGAARIASAEDFGRHDLIVTSYGTLVRDEALFRSASFACAIADEAQHLKNRRSQNARTLRAISARSRFLLTGTPLENSLDDLRSLFEFLLPGYLELPLPGTRPTDQAWLDERLRAQTAPYILRRTKSAVAPELPPKLEQVIWCELAPEQAALYRRTQECGERELFDLEAGGTADGRLRLAALTHLLRLRQICCDPRLVGRNAEAPPESIGGPAGSGRPSDRAAADPRIGPPGMPPKPEPKDRPEAPAPFAGSGKLDAYRELIAEAVDDGLRVLVFSQFTSLLALLREELAIQETPHCYLDGAMAPGARQAEVDRFQKSASIPLFLLSLKAGGTGLNLTGADMVVHFDPWWNPAAEMQATDRAHRIGQTRAVTSYKLVASGTVEEKVLSLQAEKRVLLQNVFAASDAVSAKLSVADLKSLLA
ncbi:MAG: DEAD/DEAH box helicase [Opitutaceae bacterium]